MRIIGRRVNSRRIDQALHLHADLGRLQILHLWRRIGRLEHRTHKALAPVFGQRHDQRAIRAIADLRPDLAQQTVEIEPILLELPAFFAERDHAGRPVRDKARARTRGGRARRIRIDERDLARSRLQQMIGCTTPYDAATDDNDLGAFS